MWRTPALGELSVSRKLPISAEKKVSSGKTSKIFEEKNIYSMTS